METESFTEEENHTGDMQNVSTRGNVELGRQTIYRKLCLSFGLLCVLQVALNVTLRLHSVNMQHSSQLTDLNYTNMVTKITEERESLKKELEQAKQECQMTYRSLVEDRNQLLTNYTKLAIEKNRIQKILNVLTGWKSFQSNLYLFSTEEKNWEEAREDCRQRGADLVIINSQEEQDFISTHLDETWIGLTDREREGQWIWVDGTPLANGLWMAEEPNDANKGEDCAKAYGKQWNDQKCSLMFRWSCERLNSTF